MESSTLVVKGDHNIEQRAGRCVNDRDKSCCLNFWGDPRMLAVMYKSRGGGEKTHHEFNDIDSEMFVHHSVQANRGLAQPSYNFRVRRAHHKFDVILSRVHSTSQVRVGEKRKTAPKNQYTFLYFFPVKNGQKLTSIFNSVASFFNPSSRC